MKGRLADWSPKKFTQKVIGSKRGGIAKLKQFFKKFAAHFTVALLFISGLTAISVSPATAGTCTGAFPADSEWIPVRSTNGSVLTDPLNDVGSGSDNTNVDIYGTAATSSAAAGSAIDWFSTGSSGCFQFRMRVAKSAVSGSSIDNKQWSVGLGTGSTTKAWMVVNGNNNNPHNVWIYDGNPTLKFTYNFNGVGSNSTYAFATSEGSGASIRHYVYWQVPYDDLISVLGASSIFGFFAGTSQSNSFSAINRDCLSLSTSCTSPSYTSTQSVDLSQDVSISVPAPIITSQSVTKGSTSGSTTTVITGTNLTNTVRVMFGNSPATVVSSTSTSATVITPSGSVGDVNVQLETAAGGLSNTLQNAYKYITTPTATTVAATGLTSTTGQLNGTVNPGNDATSTTFCYGTSSSVNGSGALQSCTSVSTASLSGSTSTSSVSYSATLSSSTTYYYQVVATNSLGTSYGSVLNFTTPSAPVALSITNTSPITSGQVGVSYSYQFTATGGSGIYSNW